MFQLPVIKALAILKLCAAEVNKEFDLKSDIADSIKLAAQEVGFLNVLSLLSLKIFMCRYSSQKYCKVRICLIMERIINITCTLQISI